MVPGLKRGFSYRRVELAATILGIGPPHNYPGSSLSGTFRQPPAGETLTLKTTRAMVAPAGTVTEKVGSGLIWPSCTEQRRIEKPTSFSLQMFSLRFLTT